MVMANVVNRLRPINARSYRSFCRMYEKALVRKCGRIILKKGIRLSQCPPLYGIARYRAFDLFVSVEEVFNPVYGD
jgi:hypothetical protein